MQYRNRTTSRMGTNHRKQHAAQRARKHVRTNARRARAERPRNGKTALWLLLFFPVGLTRMWRNSCTWKPGVKYALTAIPLIALICLTVIPFRAFESAGSVQLVGNEKTVEVYGPEAPESVSDNYAKPVNGTVIVDNDEEEDSTLHVYATKEQTRYHLYTCKYAYASGMRLTVYEADVMGLTPCPICNPPTYAEIQAEEAAEAAAEAGETVTEAVVDAFASDGVQIDAQVD